ncbi:hypothetical protein AG1IA_05762 [Rhizoctonia solani AG-1 IA]|uniref:Uncharacterized protein n=1 Tax=Thanatephorus cucumeris (strain AG1-IA) TaxID=983506 RepID=L8WQD4_THACA|nr:hypothetical protein AG1IA_05762 [Rhizoctonia solani AG-1 IA]
MVHVYVGRQLGAHGPSPGLPWKVNGSAHEHRVCVGCHIYDLDLNSAPAFVRCVKHIPHADLHAIHLGFSAIWSASPSFRSSPDNIRVEFTIANTGRETYSILETPTSLLSTEFSTNKFYPEKKDGSRRSPIFKGIKLKWDADRAAKGNKILNKLYDFARSGPGVYKLLPLSVLQLIDEKGNHVLGQLDPPPTAEIIINQKLLNNLTHSSTSVITHNGHHRVEALQFRANCDTAQRAAINTAIADAQQLSANSLTRLRQQGIPAWRELPRTWFGSYEEERVYKARYTMSLITRPFNAYTTKEFQDVYAYVMKDHAPNDIHLCPSFFEASTRGYNSQVYWKLPLSMNNGDIVLEPHIFKQTRRTTPMGSGNVGIGRVVSLSRR